MSAFKDHFSGGSTRYAAYRPTYPDALVDWLARTAPCTDLALDVGCGTGQLSVPLANRFARVVAIDASATQIEDAAPHPRVDYRVAPAQRSGLDAGAADLVVAAQAAHWFDLPPFYEEVRRVGREGALIALVCYGILTLDDPDLLRVFDDFYRGVVGTYWPPERRHVEEGYASLDFPFAPVEAPAFAMEVAWDLPSFIGYVGTWSAVKEASGHLGDAPLERFAAELAALWGDPGIARAVRFPLSVRAGRVASRAFGSDEASRRSARSGPRPRGRDR